MIVRPGGAGGRAGHAERPRATRRRWPSRMPSALEDKTMPAPADTARGNGDNPWVTAPISGGRSDRLARRPQRTGRTISRVSNPETGISWK